MCCNERKHCLQRRPKRSRSRSRSRRRSHSPATRRRRTRSASRSRSRSRSRDRKPADPWARSLSGPINAPHEEAVEFAKISKRENRVYVGNLSYEVKYRDLIEFMRGGGLRDIIIFSIFLELLCGVCLARECEARRCGGFLSLPSGGLSEMPIMSCCLPFFTLDRNVLRGY